MKTIDEIRRDNIELLVKELGSISALASKLERSQSQVSQLKNGAKDSKTGKPRGMHGDTARYIEDRCGKQKGWLDVDRSSGQSTALGPAIQTPSVSTPVARLIQRLTEMEAAGQLTPPLLRALETLLEAVAPRRTSQKLLAAQALLSTQQILQGSSPHENPPPDPAQEHTPSAE